VPSRNPDLIMYCFGMGRIESYFPIKMDCQENHFQTGGRVRRGSTLLDSPVAA
jgi:hypothetical protein